MEHIGTVAVAHEEHVANKRIESVAQPKVFLSGHAGEAFLNLALRVHLGLHAITLAVDALQVFATHLVCTLMEDAVEHPIGDVRLGEALLLEVQSVLHYLLTTHSLRRNELTCQTVYAVDGYLPDAEESQHVVNAVSIEELRHVLEAAHPPLTAVLQHLVPVVCGESPVLSVDREIVWRRSRLSVKIEVFGFHPHVATISVYADGDVSLQDYALLLGILVSCLHLRRQYVLHEIVESHLLILLCARIRQHRAVILVPCIMVFPLCEIGCAILVSQP